MVMENKVIKEMEITLSRNALIKKYQYLISKIALQFDNISDARHNLEEVGYLGLLNAVNLYDYKIHKISFKTYAQILITEEMHQYLLNNNCQIDCPEWVKALNEQVNNFTIHYRKSYNHFPEITEIAAHFNITESGLREILKGRESLKEIYLSFTQGSKPDFAFLQLDVKKIKNQNYKSFNLPIEDLIILRRTFKKIREFKEDIIYFLFILDLKQTKLARTLGMSTIKECN